MVSSLKSALLVVDVQNDFCPGGALPVHQGDQVVPVLNRWIERARHAGSVVVVTRDWHPAGHCSFTAQGGPWPEHCVQGSPGAEFRDDLQIPADALFVGEVGLGGEVRPAPSLERRLSEAARLGFRRAYVSARARVAVPGVTIVPLDRVGELAGHL